MPVRSWCGYWYADGGEAGKPAPEVANAGLPQAVATLSGGSVRKLIAQSDNQAPPSKSRLITRLADDRKARFTNDRSEGVFRSGRGNDTFGPHEDGFACYHTFDSGHTYTAVVPTEFILRLEACFTTNSPGIEAKARVFLE